MESVFKGLEPREVWRAFAEVSQRARCSGGEAWAASVVERWARAHGLGFKRDKAGNVFLSRQASPGHSSQPPLLLQAHLDTLCEQHWGQSQGAHPPAIEVEEGRVKARVGVLGADNGLGVALALALLADGGLEPHGPLEALLTAGKESGFQGVRGLQRGFTSAPFAVNLDAGLGGVVVTSCAGLSETTYTIKYRPREPGSREAILVGVGGLTGGHPGREAHLPRLNANRLLAEGLLRLSESTSLRLCWFNGGGHPYSVARRAEALVLLPRGETGKALEAWKEWGRGLDRSAEKGLEVWAEPRDGAPSAPAHESEKFLGLVAGLPHGATSWSSEQRGLPRVVNNNGLVRSSPGVFQARVTTLSTDAKAAYGNQGELAQLGRGFGAQVSQSTVSPSWRASESRLAKLAQEAVSKAWGVDAKLVGVPAALECGFLADHRPAMGIVSLGPTIVHPYTRGEYVEAESVAKTYQALKNLVRLIATLQG